MHAHPLNSSHTSYQNGRAGIYIMTENKITKLLKDIAFFVFALTIILSIAWFNVIFYRWFFYNFII